MSETAENLREPDADAPGIVPPSAPEPATHAPAVDLVKAQILISVALVESVATPEAMSRTLFGVVASLESVKPAR